MKKLILAFIVVGAIIGALLGMSIAQQTSIIPPSDKVMSLNDIRPFSLEGLWLIKQVKSILERYQVDGIEKIDEEKFVHDAIRGMLKALDDPYTRFVDQEELKEEKIDMQGEFGGIGVYIGQRDGRTMVISPIEDTPGERVGLKPKDEIVKVNDDVVASWELNQVVKVLRGKPGTSVTVWIRREGEDKLLKFDIVREVIKIKSVKSRMLSDDIGYIRLTHFNQKTSQEMKEAILRLKKSNPKGYILDVRNNPGGLLNAAVDVSSYFLPDGLVVSVKGRATTSNEEYEVSQPQLVTEPLVILINEGSASASEIVAGALKDRGRAALLVGSTSFGKGSVQTLFPLPDGSGVYVTIARYYTPTGRVIDHRGLSADIEVVVAPVSEDTEGVGDGKDAEDVKDVQLERAIEELKKILHLDSNEIVG